MSDNSTEDTARENVEISSFIKKVDSRIRDIAPNQYTPTHVSIGPYHLNRELPGNEEKNRQLDEKLKEKAQSSGDAPRDLSELKSEWLSKLSKHESRAKRYYKDVHSLASLTSEGFLNMLLSDGCYILSLFVPPPQRGRVALKVQRDVIYLAENQIPFFILEKIHEIIGWGGTGSSSSLVASFGSYIQDVLTSHGYATPKHCEETLRLRPRRPDHLLHLLHMLLVGNDQPATEHQAIEVVAKPKSHFLRWRQATQYNLARVDLMGVDLISSGELGDGPARSVLDVKPRRGGTGLEFPSLYAENETWCILRNLTALEQGNANTLPSRVTAYCVLMSQLACTAEDVTLLSQRGVLEHTMGNDAQCASCFSSLCKGVIFNLDDPDLNYLRQECVALDRRYKSRPSKWTAWMLRKYCLNPCVAVGSVVAIVVIGCTVLQAVYTVLKYKKGAH